MQQSASSNHNTPTMPPIAIIGAGSIGVAFACTFTRAGFDVHLYDMDAQMLAKAPAHLAARLQDLQQFGLLEQPIQPILDHLALFDDQAKAVANVGLVIECAPEKLEIKRQIFKMLDHQAPEDAILASASSAIPASQITEGLKGQRRCLVAHPGNPPFLIPVIEIVPSEQTDAQSVAQACALFKQAGMMPVQVNQEIEGFVFNRLQGAVLREAYCLVRDGIISVEDLDLVVKNGLGLRWSFMGPFETVDLNTRGGIAAHADKMGPAYARMGALRGQNDPWTPDLVAKVTQQRREILPLDDWEQRVAWRDRQLMALMAFKHRQTDAPDQ